MKRTANHVGTIITIIKALLILVGSAWLALPSHVQASIFAPFTRVQIEGPYVYAPPWGKALGDIDGDGYPDIAAGFGGNNRQVFWYQYPTWSKHRISNHDGGEDIQLIDVNNDGSLDVVTATSDTLDGVAWYENPRGHGGNPATDTWTRHIIESPVNFYCGHDVLAGDLDGDGKVDVVIRVEHGPTLVYLQIGPDSWTKIVLSNASPGEGSALLDVNRDGKVDIVENGYWLEQPADPVRGNWVRHDFASWSDESGVMVGDINKDGRPDVVLSPEEFNNGRISWFEQPADPINGTWVEHVILNPANYVHRVRIGDFNKDGTIDVAFAEMSNSTTRRVGVLYNNDGAGTSWSLQVLATTAGQNIAIDDVDGDGDLDIVNADWGDNGILELYRNDINNALPLDSWQYKQIDATRSTASFGLNFGDIDGDGRTDVVSGPYWYRNPGGDLSGSWTRFNLPAGMDGMLVLDVDNDGWADIIAEGPISGSSQLGIYWLKNNGQGASWTTVLVANVTPDPDSFKSRGYALGQIVPGGLPEIVLTSGVGTYYVQVPANPAQGNWPSVLISADVMPGGIAVADINGDGKLDLVGTVSPNATTVAWWQNPGTGAANWLRHDVGTTSGIRGDRVAAADINHDGRLDIVLSEANLTATGNSLFWFAQPSSLANGTWIRGTVATGQGSLNSMDVADINLDGKPDIITGEYRGNLNVSVWENVNNGASFTQHIVSSGRESYLGARVTDLDRDGAQDIVSIALDTYPVLHLWRNGAISGTPTDKLPPSVSITAPINLAMVSGMTSVSATASDNVGVVGVQFQLDGANLGAEVTAAPYSVSWNTTTATIGSHTLTAIARDAAGNRTTSSAVTVTVNNDTTPPAVSLTNPANGAFVTGTVTVSAAASDNVGVIGVQFQLDGANLGAEVTTPPYSISWNTRTVANGAHTLTAVARDAAGNSATSAPVPVTVSNIIFVQGAATINNASATSIAQAFSGSNTAGNFIVAAISSENNLTVSCSDSQGNTYTIATTQSDNTKNQFLAICYAANVKAGPNSVTATLSTAAGYRRLLIHEYAGIASVNPVDVVAKNNENGNTFVDTTTSTAAITTAAGELVFSAVMDDEGVNAITAGSGFTLRQSLNNTDLASEDQVQASAGSIAGTYTFNAPHRYLAQMVAFKANVGADTTPPVISGVAVTSVGGTSATIQWTTNEASDSQVEYGPTSSYGSATILNTALVTAHSVLVSGLSPSTTYHYRVDSRDALGNLATSADFSFVTLDTIPPTVTITNPGNGTTVNDMITLTVAASDNVGVAGVQYYLDNVPLGAEQTTSPYSLSWNTTTASDGAHTLKAVARDGAGNTGQSAVITVQVSNSPIIAFKQAAGTTSDTTSTTVTQAFATATTAGNLIVAAVSWGSSDSLTCSDSQGNVYTTIPVQYDVSKNQSLGICYAANIKGDAVTVTATFNGTAPNRCLLIQEYTGIATDNPVDVTAKNNANGTTTADGITSTAAITTASGDLIFGAVMDDTGLTSIQAGTNFALRGATGGADFATEDMVQNIAGSVAATWTFSSADRYLAQIVAFKHR